MALKRLILATFLLSSFYLPQEKDGRLAAISESFPNAPINFLQGLKAVNDAIQKPFRNLPLFKKATEIVLAPDVQVFGWLKSTGTFFKKIWGGLSGVFKFIGQIFVWLLEFMAKLIRIGIN